MSIPYRMLLALVPAVWLWPMSVIADDAPHHHHHGGAKSVTHDKGSASAVEVFGSFRRMIHMKNYQATVPLERFVGKRGMFGLGAVADLRGEVTLMDGNAVVSMGEAPMTSLSQGDAAKTSATLMAVANVSGWADIKVPKNLAGTALEAFILAEAIRTGIPTDQPFPFLLEGVMTDYKMHVLIGPNPRFEGHGGKEPMARQHEESGKALAGAVVGFFAPAFMSGILTHPGEKVHAHFVDKTGIRSAHLDRFGIAAGAILKLPLPTSTNARQELVAEKGAKVMPFALKATQHVFIKTSNGGVQQVIVRDPQDEGEIQKIREHLQEIARDFSKGDFSAPAKIHGADMPGLAELSAASVQDIKIDYTALADGAQVTYFSAKPDLVAALHKWFDSQLSDHGSDAVEGHHHQH